METLFRLLIEGPTWFRLGTVAYILIGLIWFLLVMPYAKNKQNTPEPPTAQSTQQTVQGSPGAVVVQGNSNIITLDSSHEYRAPSQDVEATLLKNLMSFKAGLGQTGLQVHVEIEAGNSLRDKVATTLGNALSTTGIGSYPQGNTYMGRFPGHPVTMHFSPQDQDTAFKFKDAISVFIRSAIHMEPLPGFSPHFFRIYLNGEPLFNKDGSVAFQ